MKGQQINSWDGGMNKDIAPNKMPPNMYFELREGEVLSSREGNSYAVSPVQGNKFGLVIPRIPKTFTLNQTEQGACVFSFLFEDSNGTLQGGILVLEPDESLEFLYLQMLANPFIIAGLADDSLTIQYSSEYNTIYITFNNENVLNSITLQTGNTVIINSQIPHSPVIVGGGDFNDDFVIFTTSEDTWGQIWLAIYDETTTSITDLQLKYNGPLKLSKDKPIRRVKSVIEVPNEYGTIYWTDANNPIRALNLYDDSSLNIPIGQLSLQTSTTFGQLEINKISSTGQLPSGSTIQFTYRLSSDSGAKTQYAPLTGLLPLSESNPYEYGDEYEGTNQDESTLINKSVTLKLKNLDNNYSRIDIAAVVFKYKGIPEIYLDSDIFIPNNGNMDYTFTGSLSSIIDVLELNNTAAQIVSANDLAVKDNRLIAFGIKTRPDDLDFDARALSFRVTNFTPLGAIYRASIYNSISENGISNFDFTELQSGSQEMPSETSDCINPSWITKKDNIIGGLPDLEPAVNFSNEGIQCYNPESQTQGGWGPNIDFELISTDMTAFPDGDDVDFNPGSFNGDLKLHEDQFVDFTNEFSNFKSPKVSAYLKGYKRGETYRFGIKFFDKYGVAYPVKWIADFRFPDRHNKNNQVDDVAFRTRRSFKPGADDSITARSFSLINVNNTIGNVTLDSLSLRFNIKNLNQIADKISGFTIVRADRSQEDKSVLANGIVCPSIFTDILFVGELENKIVPPSPDLTTIYAMNGGGGNPVVPDTRNLIFVTPEGHNNEKLFNYSQDDYLIVTGFTESFLGTKSDSDGFTLQSSILNACSSNDFKSYQQINLNDSKFVSFDDSTAFEPKDNNNDQLIRPNRTSLFLPQASSGSGESGYSGSFLGYGITPADSVRKFSYHSTTSKYWLNVSEEEEGLSLIEDGSDNKNIYNAEYCRDIYSTQYGGYTYDAKQNNTNYIDCSSFVNVKTNTSYINVFGGDTTVHTWDVYWGAFNFIKFEDDAQEVCHGVKMYLPIESSYNLEFRSEARALYDYDDHKDSQNNEFGDGLRGMPPIKFSTIEDYNYNNAYSQNNIINQSRSKNTISKATSNLPSSIWASEPKILGEVVDSWRTFLINNLYDLDAVYGPINRAEILNNNIVTIQDEAVAFVPINERVMITDETSTALTLGTGDVIGKHKYITTTSGSKQPFSVVQSDRGIYYFDTRNKKLNRIGQGKEPISVMKGMDSYFRNAVSDSLIINEFNPLNNIGIVSEINRETDKVYISLLGINKGESNDGETVVFNERNDNFIYLSRHAPRLYISNSSTILTPNPVDITGSYDALTSAWIEGQGDYSSYYGNTDLDNPYKTELKFYVNKEAPLTKTFNNVTFDLEGNNNITRITGNTYDQESNNNTTITKRFRTYRHTLGRNLNTKERLMGPWMLLELEADNSLREYFALYDVVTYFDVYNLNA
jgi:hypothetical protein